VFRYNHRDAAIVQLGESALALPAIAAAIYERVPR
jgi:hypothetical protein